MNAINPVIYAVGWFAVGAVAGAQWTRLCRDVRVIATSQDREEPVPAPEVTAVSTRRARLWRTGLDVLVIMLFVASAVQAYVTYGQIQDVVACQRAYQNGFADALDARATASTEAQNALDELMTTVGQLTADAASPETRAQFRDALANYLSKRSEAKKKQQENPYPPPPRDACSAPQRLTR